ncbi:TPA: TetR/AcrR family transcriptional regulator [Bacillus thuringiensis]|uniref:TetR family transcriptional regulator n=2 Tax=Bacillus thuringiensis TaxID=1428 RepID=A0A9X6Q7C0_BACTU|nr:MULTISPECIES: TetR/AcrR family transcriptional regulator [Bacillus cereus group]AJA23067.1 TetR family transcriptional regulator [Bacillus thuringiensis serovar galleriae]EEM56283.1 Transcriptional regulator, TetR [Bacillus thuringiensis serovar monterrey BGSC 4AJ1]ETE95995.1 TetR family transcriptional regulator [Bacillus thuringiensis serovar aizawai str. Leapi01]ETE96335.1 TetR family transcriptional regulator [Bacillus thuringiensis serovar aizawai str. Hu4-2]KAB1370255.1 TetR/AcrR fami
MKRISKEPDIRRQELMDIGFELYMKNGMGGFSIKDVVNHAGVATGLFYYYFKSKEDFVDEILNDFIVKNIEIIQQILTSNELLVMQKMKNSLDIFWTFIEKLAPYKDSSSFQTEQHYLLEQKLFMQLQPLIQQVIEDGVKIGVFHTDNLSLTSGFILYGLSSIAHSELNLNLDTKKEMINLIFTTLKYDQKEDI